MKTLVYSSLKLCLTILIISFGGMVYSQVSNYAFTETTGTYQAILGNSSLGGWSGTANGTNNPPGGVTPTSMTLPFDFCMGGTIYTAGTTISMDYNGWIAFGNPTITAATRQAPLTHINNSISAFGVGLQTTGNTNLSIRVFGSSPNRVIVFQWGSRFFGDYTNSNGDFIGNNSYWQRAVGGDTRDYLHFQIRLYETTNVIEFHYLIGNPRLNTSNNITNNIQVGLRGNNASDFIARTKSSTGNIWNGNNTMATGLPSGTSNTMNFTNTRNSPNNKPQFLWPSNRGNTTTTAGPGTGTIFRWSPVGGPSAPVADHSGCYFSPLPVELTNFAVANKGAQNKIYWSTATEENSDFFIVERSLNGADWDLVGRIESAGNSTITLHYELEDHFFEPTINYYRLKQFDFDGESRTYGLISVDNRAEKSFLLKTVNLMGQEVDQHYKGIVIDMYSDGSSAKYYRD